MRSRFITLMFLCIGLSCVDISNNGISVIDLKEIIEEKKDIQLVDVRTEKEYRLGHIGNAILIDVKEDRFYKLAMDKLDKKRPVYLYCKSGKRGRLASGILEENGFKEIYNLNGGIINWQENNLKIEN